MNRLAKELQIDRNASVEVRTITGEALTIPAGAAGTVVVAQLANFPVRNASGNGIGGFGDSSLELTSSTAFTDEVAAETPDADLANGEYWVDYLLGEVRGKKDSTSTSATAEYKIAVINMSIDDTDVTLTVDTTGMATSAKQDSQITQETAINTVLGTTADAAITTNTTGSISGKLRGLVAIFADVWNSTSHFLSMSLATLLSGEDQTNNVLQITDKPLAVSTYTCVRDSSSALEASSISKNSAGNLFRAFGMIDKSAASGMYYVLLLDSSTLPADGAVTHLISPIPINHTTGTDSSFDTDEFRRGVAAASGIVIVLSTTAVTKTIVTGGNVALFATTLTK